MSVNNEPRTDKIKLSIIIPCLNEEETLARCIKKARASFASLSIIGEVIVADNGSSDRSPAIAAENGALIIEVLDRGYGAALRGGIARASGEYIIMGDADDSYDFREIAPFLQKLEEGYDLVMGCRLPKGGGKIMTGAMPWKHRWIGNPILSAIGKLFFRSPVTDFHCGLRAFRRAAYEIMDLHTTGMEFASEMVIKASLKGMKVTEVPITLYKDGRSRPPHLRSWRDGWRHLRFMLLYSPRWLFLIPGMVLLLLGTVIGTILTFKMVTIGTITFGLNTLLICAMSILVGFQLIMFSIFTKVFAISEGLLPADQRIEKMNKVINLETGLLVGALFSLIGLGFILYALYYWREHGFGPISFSESLRLTIPGITILTIGVEIIFSSFFLSILGLRRK
ncbi:MAG: glycosyltransferase family 2 protein [bacterium]|nr:glycosyltransferase family 2 protein [bacterium]